MCGIAGLIDPQLAGAEAPLAARATAMANAIAHRGPDGSGVWVDAAAGVALAHRRLAILDLTPTGAQPMISADGRWVISYNGEVYNGAAIAAAPGMAGVPFRGRSDTEVIVESVARRGLDPTLADLNGMFAMALWDRSARTLHLVRDRLGIKPLFYCAAAGRLAFGSELKSLLAGGAPVGPIDPASVASFLRFGYVPSPHAILRGVAKVMPGEIVSLHAGGRLTRRTYWSLTSVAAAGQANPLEMSDADAVERLHGLLAHAVAGQMIADVPLGAFLSGGIDSSMVVALMVAARRGPVRSFSIGFPEGGYDESRYAAAVARHLGTCHEQLIVTAADALAVVPRIPEIYDEPFADSSQIPTVLISQLTRRYVTVALSGDGGDELFAGYNRYFWAETIGRRLLRWPLPLRRAAARMLHGVPDVLVEGAARLLPRRAVPSQPLQKLEKAASILPLDAEGCYLRLLSQCAEPSDFARLAPEHPLSWRWDDHAAGGVDPLHRMQLIDTANYLPDDILQKVDRASMAFALEVRPPFLDHRVVEFALSVPRHQRIRNGEGKWLLRRVLDRHVPHALVDRPKMGFGVPLADWLRGPLRDWAEDLLDRRRFGGGLLDVDAAHRLWLDHTSRRREASASLWTLLMYEAWRRRWGAAVTAASETPSSRPPAVHGAAVSASNPP